MNTFSDILPVTNTWSTNLLEMVIVFIPKLILAIIIRVVARLLAKAIRAGLIVVFEKVGLEGLSKKVKIDEFLKKTSLGSLSSIVADIVFWIIYLIGINIAFETLGLIVISSLISDLIVYIPNLFIAVIIILIGSFVAKFVKEVTNAAVATAESDSTWLGNVTHIVIMVFVLITALKQAQVDISFLTDNINTIVMGIMLAIGLAFGLGGKEKAKEIIDKYIK